MAFEHLRVYQAAELLDQEVRRLVAVLPYPFAKDVDQLMRALGSILYNIAEANGSISAGRRRYHYEVAMGSADEARAILRRMVNRGALEPKSIRRACALTTTITKMLIAIINKPANDPHPPPLDIRSSNSKS